MVNTAAIDHIIDLRQQHINPAAKQLRWELVDEAVLKARPLVLLLGNHSSGKSSFINHLLSRTVQRTGVAPTDDGFTILLHGKEDRSIDGEALTSNPELPFAELRRFGPGLVQHLMGRAVQADLLHHVNLIDSPGMIDSAGADSERPYDFPNAVRWFANKADLILLFFDPEKPGTTGETIQILTESLAGIDHKLRIVMNKMDLFDGMRDFARTYGALCWNLSRSLQTKDMPHIYTTVLPNQVRDNSALPLEGFAAALLELESYIAELPERRVDSVITRVIDEGQQVLIRGLIVDRLRRAVGKIKKQVFGACLLLALIALAVAWVIWTGEDCTWQRAMLASIPVVLFFGLASWLPGLIGTWRERRGIVELDSFFREEFRAELAMRDHAEDLTHDWQRVRPTLLRQLSNDGLKAMGKVRRSKLVKLKEILEGDLKRLRKID